MVSSDASTIQYRFPDAFLWGTATSCYQIEGGYDADGKGPSIWDAFTTIPGKTYKGQTGRRACDHYNLWAEDIDLMRQMGLQAYRFSTSWPRILPQGRGKINQQGIDWYSRLVDALLEAGIQPWATLYHWDLPLTMQFEKDGWLNPDMAHYFADYAELCFEHLGDRVKHWITLNEPWVVAMLGYGQGIFAPGRISNREPYQAAHHLLRAHAYAVERYRQGGYGGGRIGLTNNCDWREPASDLWQDRDAAERALQFFLGWFADPVYFGAYPEVMHERLGDRLPHFTPEEQRLLRGSSDFFGLNHYTTMLASHAEGPTEDVVFGNGGLSGDQDVSLAHDPSWKLTEMQWAIVPWGCRKLLHWIDERYQQPKIVITENGCAFDDRVVNGQVEDDDRLNFYRDYLQEIHAAMSAGVKVSGYFAWSFMDNFEWTFGYSKRFGLHYVDFNTLERIPKASAHWYRQVIANHGF